MITLLVSLKSWFYKQNVASEEVFEGIVKEIAIFWIISFILGFLSVFFLNQVLHLLFMGAHILFSVVVLAFLAYWGFVSATEYEDAWQFLVLVTVFGVFSLITLVYIPVYLVFNSGGNISVMYGETGFVQGVFSLQTLVLFFGTLFAIHDDWGYR